MNIVNYLFNRTKNYHKYIVILVIGIVFYFVSRYAYSTIHEPFDTNVLNDKIDTKDIANTQEFAPSLEIYFFFADWCPHCKTAKPEWDAFKRKNNGTVVSGYLVECIDVNCTEDSGENTVTKRKNEIVTPVHVTDLIRKYNVNGYPTIKMVKDDKVYEYEAKVSERNLTDFMENSG